MSKSKDIGLYMKFMISEIILLLSCNGNDYKLIPHLLINNMLTFLFDLREGILQETDKEDPKAIESEINIA